MTAAQESTSETAGNEQPESALLVAARQLSEEAWLRPDVAGLSIARQRAVAIRRSIRGSTWRTRSEGTGPASTARLSSRSTA